MSGVACRLEGGFGIARPWVGDEVLHATDRSSVPMSEMSFIKKQSAQTASRTTLRRVERNRAIAESKLLGGIQDIPWVAFLAAPLATTGWNACF